MAPNLGITLIKKMLSAKFNGGQRRESQTAGQSELLR